jgi:hypothetical protein
LAVAVVEFEAGELEVGELEQREPDAKAQPGAEFDTRKFEPDKLLAAIRVVAGIQVAESDKPAGVSVASGPAARSR